MTNQDKKCCEKCASTDVGGEGVCWDEECVCHQEEKTTTEEMALEELKKGICLDCAGVNRHREFCKLYEHPIQDGVGGVRDILYNRPQFTRATKSFIKDLLLSERQALVERAMRLPDYPNPENKPLIHRNDILSLLNQEKK